MNARTRKVKRRLAAKKFKPADAAVILAAAKCEPSERKPKVHRQAVRPLVIQAIPPPPASVPVFLDVPPPLVVKESAPPPPRPANIFTRAWNAVRRGRG